jgi:transcriptional regulator with XRE-family HTH domain
MTTFATVFAQAQAQARMSDTSLARELGVSQPTVTRWRSGQTLPAPQHLRTLSKFTRLPQRDLRALINTDSDQRPTQPKGTGTFADLIRSIETARNIQPAEAPHLLGIDKSTYYRYRRGTTTPALEDIPDLAGRLQVTETQVLNAVYTSRTAHLRRTG